MDEMEFKLGPTEFKATGDKGEYEGYFSVVGNLDDGGDIIERGAFTKTLAERSKRVKVFYAHDWQKLIGPTPDELKEDDHGLFAKGHLTLASLWGKEVWELMKDNALNEGSIGYRSLLDRTKYDDLGIRHLYEIQLFEISPVPLGLNALTEIRTVKAAMLHAIKAAIPPHETAKASEDTSWDGPAVMAECEGAKQLRKVCAWVDPEGDPDSKSSYKLPHHLADGHVVLKGVQAAGAAIMGSRGGVKIPDADVAGVKKHLAKHYAQFEKTPPWDESAGLDEYLETLSAVMAELKSGRMFSADNLDKMKTAMQSMRDALGIMQEMITAAEPEKGIDPSYLLQKVRLVELMMHGHAV